MGAVGLAIWVPSVVNQPKNMNLMEAKSPCGYSSLSSVKEKNHSVWNGVDGFELSQLEVGDHGHEIACKEVLLDELKVSMAMSKNYVKVPPDLGEAIKLVHENQQTSVLVVDHEEFLEGVLAFSDIRRRGFKTDGEVPATPNEKPANADVNSLTVSSCLTRGFQYRGRESGLLTCFADTDLTTAKQLMEAKGVKQLPVVKRGGQGRNDWKRRLVGLLYYDSISHCLQEELHRWNLKCIYQEGGDEFPETQ